MRSKIFLPLLLFLLGGGLHRAAELDFLQGKFDPAKHPDFIELTPQQSVRGGNYLQKEVAAAFEQLRRAALRDGVTLLVISATRNFEAQKNIWDAKFAGRKLSDGKNMLTLYPEPESRALAILRYSAMPGTSRHHWGSDFDLAFARQRFDTMLVNSAWEKGEGLKAYQWLEKNASRFGFCQPYKNPPDKRRTGFRRGYEVEKWHWSYRPLAQQYTRQLEAESDIVTAGFLGDSFAAKYARQYILNIHPDCLSNN